MLNLIPDIQPIFEVVTPTQTQEIQRARLREIPPNAIIYTDGACVKRSSVFTPMICFIYYWLYIYIWKNAHEIKTLR